MKNIIEKIKKTYNIQGNPYKNMFLKKPIRIPKDKIESPFLKILKLYMKEGRITNGYFRKF